MKLKYGLVHSVQQHAHNEYQHQLAETHAIELAEVKSALVQIKGGNATHLTTRVADASLSAYEPVGSGSPDLINNIFSSDAKHVSRRRPIGMKSHPRSKAQVGFSSSSWFNGRMLEFYWSSGFSSLNITLRYYNVVPGGSPIMVLAEKGNLGGVQSLLKNSKASITDIDNNGYTILDVRFPQNLVI